MRKLVFSFFLLLFSLSVLAEGTRTWEQSKFDDLEKGTTRGVAIRSVGGLELAPSLKPLYTTPSTYIWSIADDGQGNVYAAAGAPARVYRITPQGQASIIFQPSELQVQALIIDKSGAILAATSPDGKVYKIEHKGGTAPAAAKPEKSNSKEEANNGPSVDSSYVSSVFFDPQTKYIWDMVEDPQGRLYVATGDHGEIFRVEPNGQHSLFFKSDEAHIRVLALDAKGNLIAGSDGSGLVYRISPNGDAFVLYSAPKKEITALAIDRAGNIYAAGVGEKRGATPSGNFGFTPPPQPSTGATLVLPGAAGQVSPPANVSVPFPGMGATGSEIYQIAPDGSPKRIWSSREDVVYALDFDQQGRLLAGTGNKGKIYVIQNSGDFTDLVKASATQVAALCKASNGGLYVGTSNLGKIFVLGGRPDADGTYESDVFDAKIFSRWGRMEARGSGNFELFTRSGNVDNPDRNWSAWKKLDFAKGAELDVPPARFVQWRAVLHPGNSSPVVQSVVINYLPKNVAPEIEEIVVQPGARFNPMPRNPVDTVTLNLGGSAPPVRFDPQPTAVKDRDQIAVRWSAHDDNDDDLVYSLYYRGDGETRWKLLKDNITDKFYSFDAALLPDGGYTIEVVASDAPSHSPEEALSSSKESSRFEVDSTPPQVQSLNAAAEGDTMHITFRAVDGFSSIKHAEYSVDAGDWQYVEPVGALSDNRVENYDFSIPLPKAKASGTDGDSSEHVVVVRVYDRFDNMGAAKTVVKK